MVGNGRDLVLYVRCGCGGAFGTEVLSSATGAGAGAGWRNALVLRMRRAETSHGLPRFLVLGRAMGIIACLL